MINNEPTHFSASVGKSDMFSASLAFARASPYSSKQ